MKLVAGDRYGSVKIVCIETKSITAPGQCRIVNPSPAMAAQVLCFTSPEENEVAVGRRMGLIEIITLDPTDTTRPRTLVCPKDPILLAPWDLAQVKAEPASHEGDCEEEAKAPPRRLVAAFSGGEILLLNTNATNGWATVTHPSDSHDAEESTKKDWRHYLCSQNVAEFEKAVDSNRRKQKRRKVEAEESERGLGKSAAKSTGTLVDQLKSECDNVTIGSSKVKALTAAHFFTHAGAGFIAVSFKAFGGAVYSISWETGGLTKVFKFTKKHNPYARAADIRCIVSLPPLPDSDRIGYSAKESNRFDSEDPQLPETDAPKGKNLVSTLIVEESDPQELAKMWFSRPKEEEVPRRINAHETPHILTFDSNGLAQVYFWRCKHPAIEYQALEHGRCPSTCALLDERHSPPKAWSVLLGDNKGGAQRMHIEILNAEDPVAILRKEKFKTLEYTQVSRKTQLKKETSLRTDYGVGTIRGLNGRFPDLRHRFRVLYDGSFTGMTGAIQAVHTLGDWILFGGFDRRISIHRKKGRRWHREHRIDLKQPIMSVLMEQGAKSFDGELADDDVRSDEGENKRESKKEPNFDDSMSELDGSGSDANSTDGSDSDSPYEHASGPDSDPSEEGAGSGSGDFLSESD